MRKASLALTTGCALAITLLATTCRRSPPPPPTSAEPEVASSPDWRAEWESFRSSPHDVGGTLVIGEAADAESISPITARTTTDSQVVSLLFLPLTRIYPDLSRGPALAESWEFSDDHLSLTFHLRKDARWHDGEPVTAQDVKFTHDLITNPEVAWRAIKYKKDIERCEVVDRHRVRFDFRRVYDDQLFDAGVGSPLPHHILGDVPPGEIRAHEFHRRPVGSGPFRFHAWRPGESIELRAWENAVDGRPPLDRVIFRVVPEESVRVRLLRQGEIDVLTRVPRQFHAELDVVANLVRRVLRDRVYFFVAWNNKDPLFSDPRVRRALTHAIDRPRLVEAVLGEFGEICHGPVHPLLWAHDPDPPILEYDLGRSRKLLEEAGWKLQDGLRTRDGKTFEFTLKTKSGDRIKETTAHLVASMLAEVGIRATVQPQEQGSLSRDLVGRSFAAAVAGWSVGLKMDMTPVWHSRSLDDPYNYVQYSNPEFDALNDEALAEPDREKAKRLWQAAQRVIIEDQPYTFLYVPKQVNYIHRRFRNVRMVDVGWSYNLEQWWIPSDQRKER